MNFYPYSSPIILTDDIYQSYGGNLQIATSNQRQAAYWLAEERASNDLSTFLLPTIVSGTYPFISNTYILEHAYLHRIILTRFIDFNERIYYTVNGTGNNYVAIANHERSLVDVNNAISNCCSLSLPSPYQVQFVYEAGLMSGTSYRPNVLLALSTYATIIVNEIVGFGNESPGDAGVSQFSNQDYSERRKGLINTAFGNSAKANFAHKLLADLRKQRFVSL